MLDLAYAQAYSHFSRGFHGVPVNTKAWRNAAICESFAASFGIVGHGRESEMVGPPGLEPGTKGFTLPGISPRVDYLITRSLRW